MNKEFQEKVQKKEIASIYEGYIKYIGKGTHAEVYTYKQKNFPNSIVAVKQIPLTKLNASDIAQKNVLREIEITKSLDHENILKLYEFFYDDQYLYLVFDFCDNGDLEKQMNFHRESIQKNNQLEEVAIYYLKEILKAFEYLYQMKVMHRDVKPSNIFLNINPYSSFKSKVKLGDFGIARLLQQNSKLTSFCGSQITMAPEMANFDMVYNKDKQDYNEKVDIFSIGKTIQWIIWNNYDNDSNDKSKSKLVPNGKGEITISPDLYLTLSNMLKKDHNDRITFEELFKQFKIGEKYNQYNEEQKDDNIEQKKQIIEEQIHLEQIQYEQIPQQQIQQQQIPQQQDLQEQNLQEQIHQQQIPQELIQQQQIQQQQIPQQQNIQQQQVPVLISNTINKLSLSQESTQLNEKFISNQNSQNIIMNEYPERLKQYEEHKELKNQQQIKQPPQQLDPNNNKNQTQQDQQQKNENHPNLKAKLVNIQIGITGENQKNIKQIVNKIQELKPTIFQKEKFGLSKDDLILCEFPLESAKARNLRQKNCNALIHVLKDTKSASAEIEEWKKLWSGYESNDQNKQDYPILYIIINQKKPLTENQKNQLDQTTKLKKQKTFAFNIEEDNNAYFNLIDGLLEDISNVKLDNNNIRIKQKTEPNYLIYNKNNYKEGGGGGCC